MGWRGNALGATARSGTEVKAGEPGAASALAARRTGRRSAASEPRQALTEGTGLRARLPAPG